MVEPGERSLFTPAILGSAKNASYDPAADRLGGTTVTGGDRESLKTLMRRFSDAASACVDRLLPSYRGRLTRARASFRPAEIAGRATTWRKDDTRLHVDSFPATPSGGRRILRVFTNVNPDGHPRSWRIGDDFEAVARRFADRLRLPLPGAGLLLALVRVTKTPRSAYDALMLQLHDAMKGDEEFQARSPQTARRFSGRVHVAGVHRPGEPRRHGGPVSARADVSPASRRDARAGPLAASHPRAVQGTAAYVNLVISDLVI